MADDKIRIGRIRLLDILRFKNLASARDKVIQKAPPSPIPSSFPINEEAKELHPENQTMVVKAILDHPKAGAKTFVLEKKDGSEPAFFRAGQYVSIRLEIDGSTVTRPYSLSSSPKDAEEGRYAITVKGNGEGLVSSYLLSSLKVRDELSASGPQGNFYYERLRDSRTVVALAGGSGITPFFSMAQAIRDGYEDFSLILLYGSRRKEGILFEDELKEITRETDKVKVVHVLSEEEREGYEKGFLNRNLIQRYGGDEYSLFLCGPSGMYRFLEKEIDGLDLPRRRVRREVMGSQATLDGEEKRFRLEVHQCGKVFLGALSSKETLLVALERNGIPAPSRCRSGECGWCRSHLLSGSVTTPVEDYRRYQDKEGKEIHPCVTYPLSDIVLEVPGTYH
ncbi:MAG: 2Fe-2S iron-sulfur cluster binding domain-containing protein [Spirochaetales bacterium]|nr:2Fe-2S iron-sulfur cluster binding domain-containing protein [Candidatus Physcosoma equi]